MIKLYPLTFAALLSVNLHAQNPQWVLSGGSSSADEPYAIALDAAGNTYICGYFQGTFIIGGTQLVSAGQYDAYVAKINSSGAVVWAKRAGGTGWDYATDIAIDDAGNVYIAGHCEGGAAQFGTLSFTPTGTIEGYAAKMAADGSFLWVEHTEGAPGTNVTGDGIAVSSTGDVVLCGNTNLGFTLQGSTFTNYNDLDMYIACFNSSGVLQWGRMILGNLGKEEARSVAYDNQDRIILVGRVNASADLGGVTVTPAGTFSPFVAQFQSNGVPNWAVSFGSTWFAGDEINDVEIDSQDRIVVCGQMYNGGTINGNTLSTTAFFEGYVACVDDAGSILWSDYIAYTTGTGSRAYGVGIDANDDAFVAGYFDGSAATVQGTAHTGLGLHDIILSKYSVGGDPSGHLIAGGSSMDDGVDVAVNAGGISLYGRYLLTCTFGATPVTSAGSTDAFVARYAADAVSVQTVEEVGLPLVSPNPASRHGEVRFAMPAGIDRIEIADALGAVVLRTSVNATGILSMSLGQLSTGCYMVLGTGQGATLVRAKLIVE